MVFSKSISLPEPLRAAQRPSFTHHSVVNRLPEIARRTLAENNFPAETVQQINQLIAEIPDGLIRQVDTPLAPDREQWIDFIRGDEGMNWLDIPWFFAEEYFYLRILEATGYYNHGPRYKLDPYAHQKRLGLESSRQAALQLAEQVTFALYSPHDTYRDSLALLLLADLWGNQNDLSMWPVSGKDGKHSGGSAASLEADSNTGEINSRILCNDTSDLLNYLDTVPTDSMRIDILLDNAGYELVTDLALADFLLASGQASQVILHAKAHPVFVSDAIPADVHQTINYLLLSGHGPAHMMAIRLRQALVRESLVLSNDPFWTSPLPAWDMPASLMDDLRKSALLISKGDANYRRLLGDRHWPTDLPFREVVQYFPFATLALRTLKSEIACGIPNGQEPVNEKDWMTNGRWGLIQFAPPVPGES
jgi:uncharacterized protein with ATP-grasp and redox domains